MKTKNYLHTHKIKLPECKALNEVSCCPYTSNHIPEYDIWKFILADQTESTQSSPILNEEKGLEPEAEK